MAKLDSAEHFDETAEITLEVVKNKAVRGVATLTVRTFILQVISFISIFLLTIFLEPAQFGIFFIVSAVINFFAYFSDIGLAAALIQKKEPPKRIDLLTTFTIQNSLVIFLGVLIFLLTPTLKSAYGLNQDGVYLLWVFVFSFLLSSLKTIPSVLLERRLDFHKLIIPQIAESLVFNITAVYLASQGWGITSFTFAVLARGVVGLVIMYLIQPWVPGISFSKDSLRALLRFGLPYQLNTFLAVAKDDGVTVFLGTILGGAGMGFLGWAQKWGTAPLRFFMDQAIKVTFPAFSRMQDSPKELSKAATRTIFFVSLLVFPALIGLILVAPIVIQIIPRYEKWQPALFALTLISVNSMWASVMTPITNMLNAIGKIKITFRLMVVWTILTWVLVPSLAYVYGINGAALGYTIVGTTSIFGILYSFKFVTIDLWTGVGKTFISSVFMGLVLLGIRNMVPINLMGVLLLATIGFLVYTGTILLVGGKEVIADFKKIFIMFKSVKSIQKNV